MRHLAVLFAATMLSTPAFALDACKPSASDPQTRICTYVPQQRYVVTGLVGYPTNLQFSPKEHIKRSDFAYTGVDKDGAPATTWRGPETKKDGAVQSERFVNNLPVWPFREGRSALVVTTSTADGSERSYNFDLIARKADPMCGSAAAPGCSDDDETTKQIIFAYPSDDAAEAAKAVADRRQAQAVAWQAKVAKDKENAALARLKVDVFYGPRNTAYQAKADPKFAALAPSQVWDNGQLTAWKWPANVSPPMISVLDPASGEERSAPAQAVNGYVVVQQTSEWWRLRLGKEAVMDVHNLHWQPDRPDTGTGTNSPDVVRQVIYKAGR